MHRLTLHIGMPKTGSTAIQRYLTDHHGERCRPKPFGAKGLAWLLADSPLKHRTMARRRSLADPVANIKAGLAEIAPLHPILSWEDLFDCSDPDQIAPLADHLFDIFDTIEVLVYLRHPVDHFPSWVSQRVRAGETDATKLLEIPPEYYAYADKCGAWDRYFTLHARDYGRVQGDIVQDFCAWLDLSPVAQKRSCYNRSLGQNGVRAGLAINAASARDKQPERRAALQLVAEMLGNDPAISLPDDVIARLNMYSQQEADRLRDFLPDPLKLERAC